MEVARLNLMLRALHGRQKLPLLTNIYNADSLRPETWQQAFPEIMKEGGFDIIIGNPPYVRQETLGEEFKALAQQNFETYAGTADLYIYFIEKAHKLLKPGGYFGMIVSNKWMRSNYGKALREFLTRESTLVEIVDFGELPVFSNAATFPVIIITRSQSTKKQQFLYAPIKRLDFFSLPEEVQAVGSILDERAIQGESWTLTPNQGVILLEKMRNKGIPLWDYVNGQIFRGVVTGCNDVFLINRSLKDRLVFEDPRSAELIKPFVMGDDVRKYRMNYRDIYVIFAKRGIDIEKYKAVKNYLSHYQERLMPKPKDWQGEWKGRKSGSYKWYEIQDSVDYFREFEKPKIIYPDIAKESRFTFDSENYYMADTTFSIPINDLYLLGVLNSRLIFFVLKLICPVLGDPEKGGRLRLKTEYLKQLPIRRIDFADPAEKTAHDAIVKLVEEMLDLQKQTPAGRGGQGGRAFRAAEAHPGAGWGDRCARVPVVWIDGGRDRGGGGRIRWLIRNNSRF